MAEETAIGVLVPTNGSAPEAPPEARPIGRAAIVLATEGIDVIFGDTLCDGRMAGYRAIPGGWEAVSGALLSGVHDRYPSQLRSEQYERIQRGLNGLKMSNPLSFTMLCRDKLATQQRLEAQGIRMPAVTGEPSQFSDCITQWKEAFLKPRYGALGIGVQRIAEGDPMPAVLPGVVPDRPDPSILQAAIEPPRGWASRTVRVLLQRTPEGGWYQGMPVVRQSRDNPVANAALGAEVVSGDRALDSECLTRIHQSVQEIACALDRLPEAEFMVEAGVDLVLDCDMQPTLIEVNSRPRGRLEVLAAHDPKSFHREHVEACARPLRVIAGWRTKG